MVKSSTGLELPLVELLLFIIRVLCFLSTIFMVLVLKIGSKVPGFSIVILF